MSSKLGRGLGALIGEGPDAAESTDRTTGITTVKVDKIIPNRYQPRKFFDKAKLQELANSLIENGIIQPIIVTKCDDSQYELVAGERRLEASKLAGFTEIPVIVRSISAKEQLQLAIIENVQREDLNPIEEARAYQQLNDEFHLTHVQISEIVGKDRATISNFIRLLKLDDTIQQHILEGQISSGHARAILQVDEKYRAAFVEKIIKQSLSVRKAEAEAKQILAEEPQEKKPMTRKLPEFIRRYQSILDTGFRGSAKITGRKNKGKIVIQYSSEEDLKNILETMKISN